MFNFSVRLFFHCIYHVKLDLSQQLNESVTIQFTQRVIKYTDWILMFILIILMFCCVTWIDGWGYATMYAHFLRNDIFVVRVLHFLPINRQILIQNGINYYSYFISLFLEPLPNTSRYLFWYDLGNKYISLHL